MEVATGQPIVCIAMRHGSRRLPGKALIDLGGGVTPVRLLAAQLSKQPHPVVFCVPEGKEGDPIAAYLADAARGSAASEFAHTACHRGSLANVLDRMLTAAERFGAGDIVRVTGDDLFVDPGRLERLLSGHVASGAGLTYSDLPKGTECQAISVRLLHRMVESCGDDTECWDKRRDAGWMAGADLRFVPLSPVPAGPGTFAIELDTPDDAETVRDALGRLLAAGRRPPFFVEDLARLHAERPFPKSKDPVWTAFRRRTSASGGR